VDCPSPGARTVSSPTNGEQLHNEQYGDAELLAFEAGYEDYCEREIRKSPGAAPPSGTWWKRSSSVVHHGATWRRRAHTAVWMPDSCAESWTALGDGHALVDPAERWLAYLTAIERSPNTVKGLRPRPEGLFTTCNCAARTDAGFNSRTPLLIGIGDLNASASCTDLALGRLCGASLWLCLVAGCAWRGGAIGG
jgi:hypothetical protein